MLPFDKLGLTSEVNYTFRNNIKFLARTGSTDINEAVAIFAGLLYPPSLLRLNEDDIVIDIGAGCGEFVLYVDSLNRNIKYKGFAIEPFNNNYLSLKKNIKENKIKKFKAIKAAISTHDGTVWLNTDGSFDGIKISNVPTDISAKSLSLKTLLTDFKIKKIQILKIDIEGHEYEVMNKYTSLLAKNVSKIFLEYHTLSDDIEFKALLKKLDSYFNVEYIVKAKIGGMLYLENKRHIN